MTTTLLSSSRWYQWSAQSSPRRAPVVMAVQTNTPQSGPRAHASFTSWAASWAVGGPGLAVGMDGFLATSAGLTPIQPHRTAASKAPLSIQWTVRIPDALYGRH